MIEKGLVTEIEPFEDVVVENPPHDWESSCDKYKTWNCIFSNIFKIVGSFLFFIAVLYDVIIIHIVVAGISSEAFLKSGEFQFGLTRITPILKIFNNIFYIFRIIFNIIGSFWSFIIFLLTPSPFTFLLLWKFTLCLVVFQFACHQNRRNSKNVATSSNEELNFKVVRFASAEVSLKSCYSFTLWSYIQDYSTLIIIPYSILIYLIEILRLWDVSLLAHGKSWNHYGVLDYSVNWTVIRFAW